MPITVKHIPSAMSAQAVPAILPLLPIHLDLRFHRLISAVSKDFTLSADLRLSGARITMTLWGNLTDANWQKACSNVSYHLEFCRYQEIVYLQYNKQLKHVKILGNRLVYFVLIELHGCGIIIIVTIGT